MNTLKLEKILATAGLALGLTFCVLPNKIDDKYPTLPGSLVLGAGVASLAALALGCHGYNSKKLNNQSNYPI